MTLHLTHEQLCDLILADSSLSLEGESRNDLKERLRCRTGSIFGPAWSALRS